ncbi:putative ribonuclease H-like domain-containing protein [Tanacetum coccineum]
MMGDHSRLRNFVKKFIGTVRFRNDHFGAIMGYGDYVIGDSVIFRVYYMEGLGHNLFFVRQFCDSDLEVAFRKHSCYVRDTDGVELIKGSRGSNLYTISVEDMMKSSPICLLSKASKNKSWLWHRRLNHLNFGTINDLARKDLVRGLPRLKFEKDHLCSACQLGKSKKHTHKPKTENTNLEVLNTLHMDLCGPMRVQTINGKKYILVIVDDYFRFTWVKFLRSKDETPEFFIKFLKQIQVGFNKTVRYIRTDNGTKFVNQIMTEYYESVIVATACYAQNRSLIHTRHNKTPYELVHDKKPDLKFSESLVLFVTLQMTAKILENYNQQLILEYLLVMHQARKVIESITKGPDGLMETFSQFNSEELTEHMAPVPTKLQDRPHFDNGQIRSGLVPNPVPIAPYVPPTNKELEILFQPIHSSSSSALQSLSLHQGVATESTIRKDNPFAPVDNDSFINVFATEPSSEASSSRDLSSAESPYVTQILHHLEKWSKDYPLNNIIGNSSRTVSTRIQLETDALWCLYNSVLSKFEPKNFKSAITEDCWFQAMQDEIHEFDRLQVWELVPQPDYVMIISLKWIYKVKLDEYGDVLKNKAWLVAKGYQQEEGKCFEDPLQRLNASRYKNLHRQMLASNIT